MRSGDGNSNDRFGYSQPSTGWPYGRIVPLAAMQPGPQAGGTMGATAIPGSLLPGGLAPGQSYAKAAAPASAALTPNTSGPLDWFHNWLNQPDTIASMRAAMRLGQNMQGLGDKATEYGLTGAILGSIPFDPALITAGGLLSTAGVATTGMGVGLQKGTSLLQGMQQGSAGPILRTVPNIAGPSPDDVDD